MLEYNLIQNIQHNITQNILFRELVSPLCRTDSNNRIYLCALKDWLMTDLSYIDILLLAQVYSKAFISFTNHNYFINTLKFYLQNV